MGHYFLNRTVYICVCKALNGSTIWLCRVWTPKFFPVIRVPPSQLVVISSLSRVLNVCPILQIFVIWKKKTKNPAGKKKNKIHTDSNRIANYWANFSWNNCCVCGAWFDWSMSLYRTDAPSYYVSGSPLRRFYFSGSCCARSKDHAANCCRWHSRAIGDHQVTRFCWIWLFAIVLHIDKPKLDEGCKACRFGWYEPLLRRRYRFYRYTVRESVGQEKFSFNIINENQQMK